MKINFIATRYFDPETKRTKWAVLHVSTSTHYFPDGRGKRAAQAFARRLNKEAA